MPQRLPNRPVRIELHQLGGHDPTGGMLLILQQMLKLDLHFQADFGQDPAPFDQSHLLNDVRSLIGRELFDDPCPPSRIELFKNGAAPGHGRQVDQLHRTGNRQHGQDRRRLNQIELIEQLDQIGWRQVTDLFADADKTLFEAQIDPLT